MPKPRATSTFYGVGKGKGRGKRATKFQPPGAPDEKALGTGTGTDSEETTVKKVINVESDNVSVDTSVEGDSRQGSPDRGTADADDSVSLKPLGRRKKGSTERHFLFTEDMEDQLIEWWREHEFFYNSELPLHKDKGLKHRLMAEKAKDFGCTSKYK